MPRKAPTARAMKDKQKQMKECAGEWRRGKKRAGTYINHVTKCLRERK